MSMMGMTDKERLSIYTIVAGVLHLGNITFEEDHEDTKGGLTPVALRILLEITVFLQAFSQVKV